MTTQAHMMLQRWNLYKTSFLLPFVLLKDVQSAEEHHQDQKKKRRKQKQI